MFTANHCFQLAFDRHTSECHRLSCRSARIKRHVGGGGRRLEQRSGKYGDDKRTTEIRSARKAHADGKRAAKHTARGCVVAHRHSRYQRWQRYIHIRHITAIPGGRAAAQKHRLYFERRRQSNCRRSARRPEPSWAIIHYTPEYYIRRKTGLNYTKCNCNRSYTKTIRHRSKWHWLCCCTHGYHNGDASISSRAYSDL